MNNKKIPINRLSKFFSEDDFGLEVEFGRELIEGDLNFTVILYQVDRTNTTQDDTYGEAGSDEIRFLPPVELKVILDIAAPENKTYNSGSGTLRYNQHGKMTLGIYEDQLTELEVDVNYGDYIGYAINSGTMIYYTVSNDGKITSDNEHTIFGFQGAFRTITCAPTDENEFRGL
jgi:hypothetical protein|tara:strand:+ start:12179 stop:12700 length:522 start_codon:yes stop_codon:yes gene_type:complete